MIARDWPLFGADIDKNFCGIQLQITRNDMRLVNIGCGHIAHPDWINIDLGLRRSSVIQHDIRRGLPFEDGSIDACYSSHVVEHLAPAEARRLLVECHRVLKPGAVIRVVVPDLETAARGYLEVLGQVRQGNESAQTRYEWIMIELLDQLVRECGGGEMSTFLRRAEPKDRAFIRKRIGLQAESFWEPASELKRSIWRKLQDKGFRGSFNKFREFIAKASVAMILGKGGMTALDVGLFRSSGEVHKWMYDHYSMGRLLRECGFTEVVDCLADQSLIPNFNHYQLDIDGELTRKPNSLFIEARKG